MTDENPILAGLMPEQEFANQIKVTTRTVKRMRRRQPDGLPWVEIGGRIYIPVAEARAFIARQIQYPNPSRKPPVRRPRKVQRVAASANMALHSDA